LAAAGGGQGEASRTATCPAQYAATTPGAWRPWMPAALWLRIVRVPSNPFLVSSPLSRSSYGQTDSSDLSTPIANCHVW